MGKGDKKTRKGKIFAGSSGNVRPKPKKELGIREKASNLGKLKVEKIEKDTKPKIDKVVKDVKPKVEKVSKVKKNELEDKNSI